MVNFSTRLLTSRWRVFCIATVMLLVLDVGRSIYARIGYLEPAEPWQDAPYEALAWPPGVDLQADAPLGERVYIERCAICHGVNGRGDGPAAPSQIPRPRDFTLGEFKYKTTPADQPPSDADLIEVVTNGLIASAMPYWEDVLTDVEIEAVVEYVKEFSLFANAADPPPEPLIVPARAAADAETFVRGAALYEKSCAECHEASGRGDVRPAGRKDEYPVPTRDLTATWTFRGGSAPAQLWLRLTTGMRPGPMPDYVDTLTDEERWDIVSYVLSLARPAPWEPGGLLDGPGHHADPVKRGEYLVHAEMCGLCHTQVNKDMIYSGDAYYLAGGMGISIYPHATYVSRNLRPDPETGVGDWSVEEIANAIRNGQTPERGLNLWGMPWLFLHSFTQADAVAIGAYLKSLPPIRNLIPDPLHFGFIETVLMKSVYTSGVPPIANPKRLIYKAGNFGQTEWGVLPRDWPQQLLMGAQWAVLALGIIAWTMAGPVERRFPRGVLGWAKTMLALLGVAVVVALGWVMYSTPVLSFIPPAEINSAATGSIPVPDPEKFDSPEQAALAERGRYLFTVTSCAFCHGNDGSGGSKVNMSSFGTLWVRNITPDLETGIGAWSDREIARSIRSGLSRDGSPLHWQGMVWDHLSNLDEEDVRSLIVYLRALPPVNNKLPAPVPPGDNDCPQYTFFLYRNLEPGCD